MKSSEVTPGWYRFRFDGMSPETIVEVRCPSACFGAEVIYPNGFGFELKNCHHTARFEPYIPSMDGWKLLESAVMCREPLYVHEKSGQVLMYRELPRHVRSFLESETNQGKRTK
jgi:hypothetical protein